MVIGVQTDKFFELNTFNAFNKLTEDLKKIKYVEDALSVSSAVNLIKDSASEKLISIPIFSKTLTTQEELDSSKNVFLSLPFYKTLLYNPESNAYVVGVRINKVALNSSLRTEIVKNIIVKNKCFYRSNKN